MVDTSLTTAAALTPSLAQSHFAPKARTSWQGNLDKRGGDLFIAKLAYKIWGLESDVECGEHAILLSCTPLY